MSLFTSLLSKIEERIGGNQKQIEEISSLISVVIKTTITPNEVTIKKGTLICNVSPTIKTELILKKEKILKILKEKGIEIYTIV